MVPLAAGFVVLVRFPFSDLSQAKLRPAVVLADAGRGDWILCQVTSKPYADAASVVLEAAAFERGSLRVTSCARPGKLFTASAVLVEAGSPRYRDDSAGVKNVCLAKLPGKRGAVVHFDFRSPCESGNHRRLWKRVRSGCKRRAACTARWRRPTARLRCVAFHFAIAGNAVVCTTDLGKVQL